MPFAMSRVGIFNESDQGSAEQQSGLQRRHKGISLEDLKKQTALRLAQEQQQAQVVPGRTSTRGVDPRTKHPVVTPQTLAARRMAAAIPLVGQPTMPVHHYQLLHHHPNPMVHHIPNEPPGMAPGYGAPQYYDQSQQGGKLNRNANPRQTKFAEMSLAEYQNQGQNTRYYSDQRTQFLRANSAPLLPANSLSSSSSGYNSASGNIGGHASSTSKLPHGLTVHELKEMTKARLQAEAADKMSLSSGTSSDRLPSSSLADMENREASITSGAFDATQANYGQNISLRGVLDGMNDSRMIPIQVQTMSFDQPTSFRQPAQVSPIPTTLQGFGHSTFSASFNDAAAQDPSRNFVGNSSRGDSFPESNWENASVTSHNSTVASEYLGSDSAFSSGVNGFAQMDDPSGMAYPLGSNGRSTAFSAELTSRENTPTSISSPIGTSYFEPSASTMSQNRQRAMTLSPRPCLSLLHEDRPGFSEDVLAIPSFASRGHARQQLTARSRRSFSPILQPQSFSSDGLGGSFGSSNLQGLIGANTIENRARTASAVSLPPISHTAEEFARDAGGPGLRRSADNGSLRGTPIQEYYAVPDFRGDALLGPSSLYSGLERRSYQTSSVFRNDYSRIPAPPGLGHNDDGSNPLVARAASLDNMGPNRARAATWAATPTSDVFGSSSGLYDCNGDDALAGDLASILKLSGAEEKPDVDRPPGMFSDMPTSFLGGQSRDF